MKTKAAEAREVASFKKGMYKGMVLERIATRPGCMDILSKPSRVINTLFYPDGRVIKEKNDE
jgi:hypothetical protein